jgi:hypothetical protein
LVTVVLPNFLRLLSGSKETANDAELVMSRLPSTLGWRQRADHLDRDRAPVPTSWARPVSAYPSFYARLETNCDYTVAADGSVGQVDDTCDD